MMDCNKRYFILAITAFFLHQIEAKAGCLNASYDSSTQKISDRGPPKNEISRASIGNNYLCISGETATNDLGLSSIVNGGPVRSVLNIANSEVEASMDVRKNSNNYIVKMTWCIVSGVGPSKRQCRIFDETNFSFRYDGGNCLLSKFSSKGTYIFGPGITGAVNRKLIRPAVCSLN